MVFLILTWFHKAWNKTVTLVFFILFTKYLSHIYLKYIFTFIWNVTSIWICFKAKTTNLPVLHASFPFRTAEFAFLSAFQFLHPSGMSGNCIVLAVAVFQSDMPLFINFTNTSGSSTVPVFVLSTRNTKENKASPCDTHCSKPKPELSGSVSAIPGQVSAMQENSGLQWVWRTLSKMVMVVDSGDVILVEFWVLLLLYCIACVFSKHRHYLKKYCFC